MKERKKYQENNGKKKIVKKFLDNIWIFMWFITFDWLLLKVQQVVFQVYSGGEQVQ